MEFDVAVIGGGVIGLAVGWRAAAAGLSVVIADPTPGEGASHVAAGMLAPVGEAHFGERALLALNLASWRRYPSFCAELEAAAGQPSGYQPSGMLLVARDADEHAALDREYRYRASLGLGVERLSARECRKLEPRLAPTVRGGLLAPGDHQVDPRTLVTAMLLAAERSGVRLERSRAAVTMRDGRATGIRVESGDVIDASAVVLAAGCWSPLIENLPSEAVPPIRPVKGQVLRLVTRDRAHFAARIVRGLDVYIVSRADGTVVIGSTVEERGFDTATTAGAVYELLRDARELMPDVAELELVEVSAGLRPGTPDNAPLIGESSAPGLIVASGHYRNGVLLAPITADAITILLTDGVAPDTVAAFAPTRFGNQGTALTSSARRQAEVMA
jgi:glycine oxidase